MKHNTQKPRPAALLALAPRRLPLLPARPPRVAFSAFAEAHKEKSSHHADIYYFS